MTPHRGNGRRRAFRRRRRHTLSIPSSRSAGVMAGTPPPVPPAPRRPRLGARGERGCGRFGPALAFEPEVAEHRHVRVEARVRGGEELVPAEDGARPGEEAESLRLLAELGPSRGEPDDGARHQDPGDRDAAHELERRQRLGSVERRARDPHELVDGDGLGVLVEVRKLDEEPRPVAPALAHPDDPAAAHLDGRRRARWRVYPAGPRRCGW